MKRYFAILFLIFCFTAISFAQSGRKIKPTPTPVPVDRGPMYSESVPTPRRARLKPSLRGAGGVRETSDVKTAAADDQPEDLDDENAVVRVETNLVTIPVSVFDRNGLYISHLDEDDFTIFEDGVEQEIAYFGTSEKPFTVVLLIDTSPSTDLRIEHIQDAATRFVQLLKEQDQVMVIEFDQNVNVLTEPTTDRERIYRAIKKADFGGGTSLYEAVDFTIKKRLSKIEGRKAIVLFTDGVDTTSRRRISYDSTLDLVEESDTLIFPVYYNTFLETNRRSGSSIPGIGSPRGTTAAEYALGKRYLDELSTYTGGRVFRAEATPGGLSAAFAGIAEELRRQYNIGYIPLINGVPGQRKIIKVRVNRPNLVLRARDSYIVGNKAGD